MVGGGRGGGQTTLFGGVVQRRRGGGGWQGRGGGGWRGGGGGGWRGRGGGGGGRGRGRGRGRGGGNSSSSRPRGVSFNTTTSLEEDLTEEDAMVAVLENAERNHYAPAVQPGANTPKLDAQSAKTWIYPINYEEREYQYEIVKKALFQNVLVALPTGLGKTFIAAVVMANFYRWFPEGKIVFMAPTKPLVAQQIEACFKIMGIPQSDFCLMTGSVNVKERTESWNKKRLFFLTPQILVNDMKSNLTPTDKFVCVVVDEAHKSTGQYAYVQAIEGLNEVTKYYRLLALSATPGNDVESIQSLIDSLQISSIEIRTEDSPDIKKYIHQRSVDVRVLEEGNEIRTIRTHFEKVMQPLFQALSDTGAIYTKEVSGITKGNLIVARDSYRKRPSNMRSNLVEKQFGVLMTYAHAYDLLRVHGLVPFKKFLDQQIMAERGNDALRRSDEIKDIVQHLAGKNQNMYTWMGHPKVKEVQDICLQHFRKHGDKTRVMIFSSYRDSVMEICTILQQHEPLLKASHFVGQSSGSRSTGLKQREQLEKIEQFREGKINILVSTSVGEEGLDIGDVDLIVCFDCSSSPIRLIQRMGRTGRKRDGSIIVLLSKDGEEKKYKQSLSTRKKSLNLVKNRKDSFRFYPVVNRMVDTNPECKRERVHVGVYDHNLAKKERKMSRATGPEQKILKNKLYEEAIYLYGFNPESNSRVNKWEDVLKQCACDQSSSTSIHTFSHSEACKALIYLCNFADQVQYEGVDFSEMSIHLASSDVYDKPTRIIRKRKKESSVSITTTATTRKAKTKKVPGRFAALGNIEEEPDIGLFGETYASDASDDLPEFVGGELLQKNESSVHVTAESLIQSQELVLSGSIVKHYDIEKNVKEDEETSHSDISIVSDEKGSSESDMYFNTDDEFAFNEYMDHEMNNGALEEEFGGCDNLLLSDNEGQASDSSRTNGKANDDTVVEKVKTPNESVENLLKVCETAKTVHQKATGVAENSEDDGSITKEKHAALTASHNVSTETSQTRCCLEQMFDSIGKHVAFLNPFARDCFISDLPETVSELLKEKSETKNAIGNPANDTASDNNTLQLENTLSGKLKKPASNDCNATADKGGPHKSAADVELEFLNNANLQDVFATDDSSSLSPELCKSWAPDSTVMVDSPKTNGKARAIVILSQDEPKCDGKYVNSPAARNLENVLATPHQPKLPCQGDSKRDESSPLRAVAPIVEMPPSVVANEIVASLSSQERAPVMRSGNEKPNEVFKTPFALKKSKRVIESPASSAEPLCNPPDMQSTPDEMFLGPRKRKKTIIDSQESCENEGHTPAPKGKKLSLGENKRRHPLKNMNDLGIIKEKEKQLKRLKKRHGGHNDSTQQKKLETSKKKVKKRLARKNEFIDDEASASSDDVDDDDDDDLLLEEDDGFIHDDSESSPSHSASSPADIYRQSLLTPTLEYRALSRMFGHNSKRAMCADEVSYDGTSAYDSCESPSPVIIPRARKKKIL
eukprot:Nk52_evm25s745 gene=Nk52_evmTU25s745